MAKSAEAFRTISEVADDLEIPKHVLRFWEVKFSQIRPMKRGGGRRYYRPEDMELLKGIRHLLHLEGYTIKGVQKILREQGVEAVKCHAAPPTVMSAMPTDAAAALITRNAASGIDALPAASHASTTSARSAIRTPVPTFAAATADAARSTTHERVAAAILELEICRALLRGEEPSAKAVSMSRRAGQAR